MDLRTRHRDRLAAPLTQVVGYLLGDWRFEGIAHDLGRQTGTWCMRALTRGKHYLVVEHNELRGSSQDRARRCVEAWGVAKSGAFHRQRFVPHEAQLESHGWQDDSIAFDGWHVCQEFGYHVHEVLTRLSSDEFSHERSVRPISFPHCEWIPSQSLLFRRI